MHVNVSILEVYCVRVVVNLHCVLSYKELEITVWKHMQTHLA